MASAANAAWWMAGERLCATGQPATAVSTRALTRALALGGRFTAFLRPGAVVLRDIALELRVGAGERMRAVAARLDDVEEVFRPRRVRGRLQRGEPRVADRARRQTLVCESVVGELDLQLRDPERPRPVVG